MTTIYAKHLPYDDGRLGEVGLDMDHAGAPTIRCLEVGGLLYAVEGSHRLAQAHERGLIPKVIILEPDLPGEPLVPGGLPAYEFDYVLALRERDFGYKPPVWWGNVRAHVIERTEADDLGNTKTTIIIKEISY